MENVNEIYEEIKYNYNLHFKLKEEQIRTLQYLISKENVLAVLPTGYGKSVLYGVLPIILNKAEPAVKHTSLVVSPLNILMEHQVHQWSCKNLKCIALNSKTQEKQKMQLTEYDIIFTSPEYVYDHLRKKLTEQLRSQIAVVAFDEAHCLTEWGTQSFRHKYAHLAELLSILPKAAVLVTTGTLSSKMREDTMKALHLKNYRTVACNPDRPEIYIESDNPDVSKLHWLCDDILLHGSKCQKTIIYCRTVGDINDIFMMFIDQLKEEISDNHESPDGKVRYVEMFSAALSERHKSRILRQFSSDSSLRVVVCTIAFGMGIDIPDIRNIILWGIPESVCHFWQQIGRCCRDGLSGKAVLYKKSVPNVSSVSTELKNIFRNDTTECLRSQLLKYLWLPEMGALPCPDSSCEMKCNKCECSWCKCCKVCREKCPCRDTA